tara:strand:+ start:437 stop:556 length:120 start_codon:yes stop_codon:yes gene_type:complete
MVDYFNRARVPTRVYAMMMTLILRDYDVHGDAGGNTATQ